MAGRGAAADVTTSEMSEDVMSHNTIRAILSDLYVNRQMDLDQILNKHYAADFRQRTNGTWIDRKEFAEKHAVLRGLIASAEVTVHEELVDGSTYAERHTVNAVNRDGERWSVEVYVFGELTEDGRLRRVEEVVLPLAGTERIADIVPPPCA